MTVFRRAAVIVFAAAALTAVAVPASASGHGHAHRRCTVHLAWNYQTATIGTRGPWAQSKFRDGYGTCGLDERAAVQHCHLGSCGWSHGSWHSATGKWSTAQAPAGSTLEWFYIEFRSHPTGRCTGHWTIYPILNNTPVSGCP